MAMGWTGTQKDERVPGALERLASGRDELGPGGEFPR